MRLGVDFGGTNLKAGIFDETGRVLKFEEHKWNNIEKGKSPLISLLDFVKEFSKDFELTAGGFSIKGLINKTTGIMEADIGLGSIFSGVNLKSAFSESLNISFNVDNDARAYAWGEWKFGAGIGTKKMVCLTLGTGVGCAFVSDEKTYEGTDSLGGILGGHISIDRNGPECPCGNRGCLELFCSATALQKAIVRKYPELGSSTNSLPEFFSSIRNGNTKYLNTLTEFQNNLAIGIVNVIHAYGPDMVVLGGGMLNSADIILPGVIEIVNKRAWTCPRGSVRIVASKLGNKAATMGAAFL